MTTAHEWIERLRLEPHPEGGRFREVYRSAEQIPPTGLPDRFHGPRAFATAIYYLLQAGERSLFHRIRSDEIWHFYDGDELALYILHADSPAQHIRLGRTSGAVPVAVVPAGAWFAARCEHHAAYALAGCTVAPGFSFEDFELADPQALLRDFPHAATLIREFFPTP